MFIMAYEQVFFPTDQEQKTTIVVFYGDKYHNFPSEFAKLWLNLSSLNKSDNCFRTDSSLTQSFKDLSWLESQS